MRETLDEIKAVGDASLNLDGKKPETQTKGSEENLLGIDPGFINAELDKQYKITSPTEQVPVSKNRQDGPGNYYGQIRPGELTGEQRATAEAKLAGSGLEKIGITNEIKNLDDGRKFNPSQEEQDKKIAEVLTGSELEHADLMTPASEKWKEPSRLRTASQTSNPKSGLFNAIKSRVKRFFG